MNIDYLVNNLHLSRDGIYLGAGEQSVFDIESDFDKGQSEAGSDHLQNTRSYQVHQVSTETTTSKSRKGHGNLRFTDAVGDRRVAHPD